MTISRREKNLRDGDHGKKDRERDRSHRKEGTEAGLYIPPFRRRAAVEVDDRSTAMYQYQKMRWEAMTKSIRRLMNTVNQENLKNVIREFFQENLFIGMGVFCGSLIQYQTASQGFTRLYASLAAAINSKIPEVGRLLICRILVQLRSAFEGNDKPRLVSSIKFISHLVNLKVSHEQIALDLLGLLLKETPTADHLEVAVVLVRECGSSLQEFSPKSLDGIFEQFRKILHEGEADTRIQVLLEGVFRLRGDKFSGHPAVLPELDLVDQKGRMTHQISLSDARDAKNILDIFRPDSLFVEKELKYEESSWYALEKSINRSIDSVTVQNIKHIIRELFSENMLRGKSLFCESIMKSQMKSPDSSPLFAALAAVINSKIPVIGLLLLARIIQQLKSAYKRLDKPGLIKGVKFITHLVNQRVAHEIILLDLLKLLLKENPTVDDLEVTAVVAKECGFSLYELLPTSVDVTLEQLNRFLYVKTIDKHVRSLIAVNLKLRNAEFKEYPAVPRALDLVEQKDQVTHKVSLWDRIDVEYTLDFMPDPQFVENEAKYEKLKKQILGAGEGVDLVDDEDGSDGEDKEQLEITDETVINLANLRRTIYSTIVMNSNFDEAGHELLAIKLKPGQEMEICIMLLKCCGQWSTYHTYYGELGQRLCMTNKLYQKNFEVCFVQQYSLIHRLKTNKLSNVAKLFAHLLGTDAIPWQVLSCIRLTEEDTTSSSRIFIKILFQELSDRLGIRSLNERLSDLGIQDSINSIFPKDNPKNAIFAIHFFTSIGLGEITENLRSYLKTMPVLSSHSREADSESSSAYGTGSD